MRPDLPRGTVTFLFTDVEGSTRLLHELGTEAYAEALGEHRRVIREACAAHDGVEVDTQGDAFFFAFPTAPGALAAAAAFTEALAFGPIAVRVGLHTGTPLVTDEGYVGTDVHRAARIAAAGHGGQVLVAASTATLIEAGLADLGEHRFKDLSAPERLYQLGDRAFPSLKTLHRTNLPVPQTPFLGREKELGEVIGLVSHPDVRLLTLTGPGGTGKTRLAAQAAGALADHFPDGVFWVPLAPIRDSGLVVDAAAKAVGSADGLVSHVGDKRLLLLLDNFEQVVDAAPEVSTLLGECPNVEVLVTSRELLHLSGEHEYAVPPLVHEEGVGLFAARARAIRPDFEIDDAVSQICRRLDDLPLALELAAARLKALSPGQILERLEQRLPLLTGGARDLPERQRTLRAAIEWSYELLSSEEQRLFARLSVFAGGCTLEAAEDVCDADLDTLQSLVEKSLLRFTDRRYWMLETIREYARECLDASGSAGELAARHARWFADLASRSRDDWLVAGAAGWFGVIEADVDNLRTAIEWGIGRGQDLALTMLADTWMFWPQTGRTAEAKRLLETAWTNDVDIELRKRALRARGALAIAQNDSRGLAEISLKRVELARETGDHYQEAAALNMLASAAHMQGEFEEARRVFSESIALFEEIGHEEGCATALGNLGRLEREDGQYERSRELLERQLVTVRSIGSDLDIAWTLKELASTSVGAGRLREAAEVLLEAFDLSGGPGSHSINGDLLATAAHLASALGRPSEAAVLFGAMNANFEEDGYEVEASTTWWWRLQSDLVEHLGDSAFRLLEQEGRSLGDARAKARAREFVRGVTGR